MDGGGKLMPEHILKLIELAKIYFQDGAPHTAADRLQSAADDMRDIARARDRKIEKLINGN
jgi:hypothetical protein